MKPILNLIKQDITTALRDNLMVYMLLAPLLIALGMKMFIPSVEMTGLSFAVADTVSPQVVERLQEYGAVEVMKEAEVQKRVEKIDTVAGIIEKEDSLTLILEGNELPKLIEIYKGVMEEITFNQRFTEITHRSLGKEGSILGEILTIVMLMMALMIGSIVSGFNIVSERDTKSINSIAVSPLTTTQFVFARGILASIVASAVAIGTSLIMAGRGVDYTQLIIALLLSSFLTTLLALIVGASATNQIGAIAMIKLLTPIYMGLPMLAFFLPDRFRYLFYWLPNYWQFQALGNIYFSYPQNIGFWSASIITFVLSGIYIIAFSRFVGKKLNLR